MTDPVNKVLMAYAQVWANDDRDGFLDLFAEGASLEDPVGSPAVVGKQALAEFWDRVHSLGMAYEVEVIRAVSCATQGALVFNVITRGPGVTMKVELVDIFEIDDAGKIASMRAFWDQSCMSME